MAIEAIIFDLDGTLVQSEKLKAPGVRQGPSAGGEASGPRYTRAIEAYQEIVGATREVASKHIMDHGSLRFEDDLRPLMARRLSRSPCKVLN
jgi:phosphoglycolate phosphatase-like HAD superfamily hydrolase